MTIVKTGFPETVQDALSKFTQAVTEEGFFDNPSDIPPKFKEHAKTLLWNLAGESLLSKFVNGEENYLFTEDEVNKILVTTIIQTNLDSLMSENLIDGIENEDGEMVYWMTEKGKEIHKNMDKDS